MMTMMTQRGGEREPLYHEVLATDTFAGICIGYGVSALRLRRANKLFNNSLTRKRLLIPTDEGTELIIGDGGRRTSAEPTSAEVIDLPDCRAAAAAGSGLRRRCPMREEKVARLTAVTSDLTYLGHDEARRYLKLNDWNLESAVAHVREDYGPCLKRMKTVSSSRYESFEFELSSEHSDY